MRRHICIDARFYGIKHTGIGRYVENLIKYLPSDPNIKVSLLIHPENFNLPELKNFDKYALKFHPYSFLSQFEVAYCLYRLKPDLVHVPHFTIPIFWFGKLVVTIHDLIKHYSTGPQTTTRTPLLYSIKMIGYYFIVWLSVIRANKIFTPTQYWKDVLKKQYRLSDNKIIVTYEGVSI